MHRHAPDFRLVEGEEGILALDEEIGARIINATKGILKQYRSDLLRHWLIYKYGGIWVDADTIMLNQVPADFEQATLTHDVVGCYNKYTKGKGWGVNGLTATPVGGKKGSKFFKLCFEDNLKNFERGEPVAYGATSVGVQSKYYKANRKYLKTKRFEHWRFNPVPWYSTKVFKARAKGLPKFRDSVTYNRNSCFYHLTNKVTHKVAGMSRHELLHKSAKPTLLQFLLQRALEESPSVPSHTVSILSRLPLNTELIGAEIGCLHGRNARELLTQRPQMTLLMVDPWAVANKDYKDTKDYMSRWNAKQWDKVFMSAKKAVRFAGARVITMRGDSVEVAETVPDASLDFVYIDANHSYNAVRADIDAWLPKIKPGGLLSGHDYNHTRETKKGHWGVTAAVNETAKLLNKEVKTGSFYTWFIERVNCAD